uniref:Cytochrome b5 heme-binding domain-containing protein n=1 Tax=Pinguiococcus pyrenoidosus TaxID=172671 RepID=A0A7R9UAF7_9STRA|mmetsp:Transcript_3329/g.13312  ORF Transcript_3329/g.13312 Transcript_3329/m.13312 type:complete len:400 (+) Transcript_3329:243-1442(+)
MSLRTRRCRTVGVSLGLECKRLYLRVLCARNAPKALSVATWEACDTESFTSCVAQMASTTVLYYAPLDTGTPLESVCIFSFLVLIGITLYRKQLSANAVYLESEENGLVDSDARKAAFRRVTLGKQRSFRKRVKVSGQLTAKRVDLIGNVPREVGILICRFAGSDATLVLSSVSKSANSIAEAAWKPLWLDRFSPALGSDFALAAARRDGVIGDDSAEPLCKVLYDRTFHNDEAPAKLSQKQIFFYWELSFREWILANADSDAYCVIALHDILLDVTDFIAEHPGSPDTLLDYSGMDATDMFEKVGHSHSARRLISTLPKLDLGPCHVPMKLEKAYMDERATMRASVPRLRQLMTEKGTMLPTWVYLEPYNVCVPQRRWKLWNEGTSEWAYVNESGEGM